MIAHLYQHLSKAIARIFRDERPIFANIAEGTHTGLITRKATAAISDAYLIMKLGADAEHVAVSGVADIPLGIAEDEAEAAEDVLTIALLGSSATTQLVLAGTSISAGDYIVSDANGKARPLPAGAGTYYIIGRAIRDASSGALCEMDPCLPVQRVV